MGAEDQTIQSPERREKKISYRTSRITMAEISLFLVLKSENNESMPSKVFKTSFFQPEFYMQ
jgi:hypothetical protein